MSVGKSCDFAGDEVAGGTEGGVVVAYSDFGSSDEGVFWAIAVFVVLVVLAATALYTGFGG